VGIIYNSLAPSDGLVLSLDTANRRSYPGSGTSWFDLSGNGNNGTLTNGASLNTGPGGGMNFDGSNDFVNCGSGASATSSEITVSCFVFWPASPVSTGSLVSNFAASFANGWILLTLSNGTVRLDGNAPGGGYSSLASSSGAMQSGWQHLCATRIRDTAKIYRNGESIANGSFSGTAAFVANPFLISQNNDSNFFRGAIDDVRIYNRALSREEISILFNIKRRRYGL